MANLSKKAIEKLRLVAQQIVCEPELYDQGVYAYMENPCGSACCIAGWLVWNESPAKFVEMARNMGDFAGEAETILGIGYASGALFGTGRAWPGNFAKPFLEPSTPTERALAAAARIERFIATDGKS